MNPWKVRVCALAVTALVASACHEPKQVTTVQASAAIDEGALDFGAVPVGEWKSAEIHVRNIGQAPFNALEALALGGNPSFVVDPDPGRVRPGETRAVRVRFHPLKEGNTAAAVSISTDADFSPQQPVPVRGLGAPTRAKITPDPVQFENLEVDSDRWLEARVENPGDIPLVARITGPNADEFQLDGVMIEPLSTQVLRARFNARTLGQRSAQLEVRPCEDCTPGRAQLLGKSVPSAFVFAPVLIPFDNIPVHETTRAATNATNITWRPVQISRLTTTDVSFTPISQLADQTVSPNQTIPVEVEFAARTDGPRTGMLHVDYQSNSPRRADVPLDATGGRPVLAVTPAALDFGELPVGGKFGLKVRLSNAGSTGQIHFQGVRAGGSFEHFGISRPSRGPTSFNWSGGSWPTLTAPNLAIDPGSDYLELIVYFQPDVAGDLRATLAFQSDDVVTPERTITLAGHAYPAGPCSLRIDPPSIDFGNVPAGSIGTLGYRFENVGQTVCAVRDIHLSNDGGGAFWIPGGDVAGGVLWPTNAFTGQVAFRAPRDGSYTGEVMITVNNPSQPVARIPLAALARPSCLTSAPSYLEFGNNRLDCPTTSQRAFIRNQCVVPVTVTSIWIGPGTSDQFSLVNPPPTPRTIAPGDGFEVQVTYTQRIVGQHLSPLFIQEQGEPKPFLVSLLAETDGEGIQSDRFVQGVANQLDVLFVISNTTTMAQFQDRLKAAIPGWLSMAHDRGVDLNVGATSTGLFPRGPQCGGGASGGEAGRLFPIDNSRPRIISSTRPDAATVIQQNLGVGTCHNLVQGLEAMRAALSPPLIDHQDDPRTPEPNDGNLGLVRAPARLAVVALADEDDHSGFDPISYVQFIRSLKGAEMAQRSSLSAIVPTDTSCVTAGPPGPRFSTVAQQTGGTVLSVCGANYGPVLEQITTLAAGPQREFRLSSRPVSEAAITVKVDDQVWDRPRWSYDAGTNSVVFAPTSVPAPGQRIEARYRALCSQ